MDLHENKKNILITASSKIEIIISKDLIFLFFQLILSLNLKFLIHLS